MAFKKATKTQAKLRMALIGVSGSGKTYTALAIAKHLNDGGGVAMIDTERGSASKYADIYNFDVVEPHNFAPQTYVKHIQEAAEAGYSVLVIDSLSHAWMGKGGALEMVDAAAKRSQGNSFMAWRDVTPQHNALIDAMLAAPMHIIVTMRAKSEYVVETTEVNGRTKSVPRKVGMAPVQRDGMEYEFDVVADLDQDNNMLISKTRCAALQGGVFHRAGRDLAETLKAWLTDGAVPPISTEQLRLIGSMSRELWGEDYQTEGRGYVEKTFKKTLADLNRDEADQMKDYLLNELQQNGEPVTN